MESYEPVDEGGGHGGGGIPEPGRFPQVVVLVIEGMGVGALPDAEDYKDRGAATLPNLASYVAGLELPLLQWMGLGNVAPIRGVDRADPPAASVGRVGRAGEGTDLEGAIHEMFGQTLSVLAEGGLDVVALGKAADVISEDLITASVESPFVADIMDNIVAALQTPIRGVVVAVVGASDGAEVGKSGPISLSRTLRQVDKDLGAVLDSMTEESLLFVMGSSGCDATLSATRGTTREYVPLLAYTPAVQSGIELGTRASLTDVAATLVDNFGIPEPQGGDSFYVPLLS